jgi:hypothetical protein
LGDSAAGCRQCWHRGEEKVSISRYGERFITAR